MDHHTDLANFDSAEDAEMPLGHLRMQGVATETIDLSSLFTHDVYTSGSFDLSGIGSTSFGRLLDALPLNLAKLGNSDFFLTCLESAPAGPADE